MKILVAPNAMKGTLDAFKFANAIETGLRHAGITFIEKLPVADGGDGTARILASTLCAKYIETQIVDPLNRPIKSGFFINEQKIAIIEMADASGLKLLLPEEYSAINTTSFGTGQLIKEAIQHGAKKILLGIGGSATVDGGMGALMALGVKFYSTTHQLETGCGRLMGEVVSIDIKEADQLLKEVEIIILSDIKNLLLGENGAVPVFAPQKGATHHEINLLQKNLSLFAKILFQTSNNDVSNLKGGGAAGGISASLNSLFNANVIEGAPFILELLQFYQKANEADIIITGEGKLDNTSLEGKASGTILKFGMKIDKPVIVLCGVNELSNSNHFSKIISLTNNEISVSEAMNNAKQLVVSLAECLGNILIEKYGK